MIYFDNAATTWPKPQSVINKVSESMKYTGANPGRGGHKMSIEAGERIFSVRETVASFFGLSNPCNVVFTLNATHSLNIVINGVLDTGDHVVCSQMDHNSVLRPIHSAEKSIEISVAKADNEGYVKIDEIEKLIKPNTKLIVLTHASNVCGTIEPVKEVAKLARKRGVLFLLDASQSAGILDINMEKDGIDFLAAPGHKALYGPMGTGILLINTDFVLKPYMYGGTGSNSHLLTQPDEIPDRFEAGTLNYPGICGLGAAVSFVSSLGCDWIYRHEKTLCDYVLNGLLELPDYKIIGKKTSEGRVGTVSFVHSSLPSQAVSEYLNSSYNIASRAMYHCAYPSHIALGTEDNGAVRVSFGVFNTIPQVKTLLYALEHLKN